MNRKVLLVDDNYLTVESLEKSLDWEKYGFNDIMLAHDGQTALELIRNNTPELIISDISMPGLSGLELSTEALKIKSSIKIILISAYDKFEYAKQAVKIGAFDYVEKPINYEELEKTVIKAIDEIDLERKNLRLLSQSKHALEEQFFRSLLSDTNHNLEESLSIYREYLNIPSDIQHYIVIAVKLEENEQIRLKLGIEDYYVLIMGLEDTIRNRFREYPFFYLLKELNNYYLIIGAKNTSSHKFKESILVSCEEVKQQYDRRFSVIFGIGSIEHSLDMLSHSYKQAQTTILYRFFLPDQNILEAVNKSDENITRILEQITNDDSLMQYICKNDTTKIHTWIRTFFSNFPVNANYQIFVFTLLYSIIAKILKLCYEMNVETDSIEEEISKIINNPSALHNIEAISTWLEKLCMKVCDNLQTSVSTYHKSICEAAMSYIEKNYMNPELNLNQIAEHVQITPTYLSSLFKKYKEQNISSVITTLRINKACQLLKTTSLSLKEISNAIGYSNQFYFSSCFKKITGITPSIYREQ